MTENTTAGMQIPFDYVLCLNDMCPKADICLRWVAAQNVTKETKKITIVNPQSIAEQEGECEHFRSCTKVLFAKGFMALINGLTQLQLPNVTSALIRRFSQRTYYRIRKGERLLSPQEQKEVIAIFRRYGANDPITFDQYIEDYDW